MLKTIVSACVFAVLAMSTTATAQPSDRRTFFTFNQPFTLPGVTLPAGKYLFRIVDDTTSRRVVQVLDAAGTKSYAMLTSIPAQRLDAPADPEIRFMETASGTPAAVKTWWYPGNTIGYEFIYPKEQALRLARAAQNPVLTTVANTSTTSDELKSGDLTRVSSTGSETPVTVNEKPEAAAAAGNVQGGEIASSSLAISSAPAAASPAANTAASVSAPVSEQRVARNETRTRLPQTASAVPSAVLLGAFTLCTGLSLLLWQRPRV
jgi:hypothetical protein